MEEKDSFAAKPGEKVRRRCTFIRRPWILMDRSKSNLRESSGVCRIHLERAGVRRSINVIARRARYKKDQFNSTALLTSCDCPSLLPSLPPSLPLVLISTNGHCSNRVEFIYAPTFYELLENSLNREREKEEKLFRRAGKKEKLARKEINGRLLALASFARARESRDSLFTTLAPFPRCS